MSNEATPAAEAYEKVTISLPKSILATIDRLAADDRRSRSNFIVRALETSLAESEPAAASATHREPIVDRTR